MDGLRFGRQFRALRIRMERRQSDVAGSSALSRSQIATIDRGQLDGVTVGALVRAAAALGADVDLRLRWRGEQLDRLIDETHAAVVEAMLGRLRRHGWLADVEVSFSIWGERGSIDIVAFQPDHGALLVVEAKSVVADSQATIHGLDRKARLACEVTKERGWKVRHVSRLLVVAASATSRRRLARLAATYDVALPARGAAVRAWLAAPRDSLAGLVFVSIDGQGGTRRRSPGRERVRRLKSAHTAAAPASERESPRNGPFPSDTGRVAVE